MEIAAWLRGLGLERYEQAFRENEVGFDVLPKLTAEDLKEIGVIPVGDRRRLLEAIASAADETSRGAELLLPTSGSVEETGHAKGAAERRQLTVLFCDLVGSTELSASLDPEDLGQVISGYQKFCANVVKRWDGHVAKYMGDGVLAYFGWPRAHEDDAERAVRAGLELVETIGRQTAGDETKLAVRVGIATGIVMVGELIGEGAAQEEAVLGETPNLAARLQVLAEPGTVAIAPATRHLLGGLFDLADLGSHNLKGFGMPVAAFAVRGELTTDSRFEARSGAALSPMVGRHQELALLLERWAQARAGEGQGMLLVGEAGIGKSRISLALLDALAEERHIRIRYQCSPYHADSALHPVIQQLRQAARLVADDPIEASLDKLEVLLDRAGEHDASPLIADLLGLDGARRYGRLELTPQVQRARTLDALVEQLIGLAASEPVLVVLEDAHWIDPTTLELIEQCLDRIADRRVMMLLTSRPDHQPKLAAHPHVTRLTLNRLGQHHGAAMVERLTGGKALPPEVLAQILAKTDGVPLFVEELTKTVLESGLLKDVGEHYDISGDVTSLAIPATLHDSLMARLDRLAPVKETAQIGAVIGREFAHDLLATVSPLPEGQLTDALNQLAASELVFRRGTPPEATYTFKHALVRDAAYHSLLKTKRRKLHASIAQSLESDSPKTATTQPELLAYHFGEAGLSNEAATYWLQAAKAASRRSANLEGVAHINRGLKELPALIDPEARARLELELQAALGGLMLMTKGHAAPEVGKTYSRVLELSEQLGERDSHTSALLGLTRFHTIKGQFQEAKSYAQKILNIASRNASPTSLVAGHYGSGVPSLQLGEVSIAHQHFLEAASLHPTLPNEMSVEVAHHPGIACVAYLSLPLWFLGYPDQALTEAQRSVSLARDLDHAFTLVFCLVVLAKLFQFRREAPSALAVLDEAIVLLKDRGFPLWLPIAVALQAWANSNDQVTTNSKVIRQALRDRRAIGAEFDKTYLLLLLSDVLSSEGRYEEALDAATEGLAVASRLGERLWEAELMRQKGEILASLLTDGDVEAEACFSQAMDIAGIQQMKSLELRAATSLARLWCDQDKHEQARDLLAPVYGWFTEGFDTADLKDARTLLEQLGWAGEA